MPIVVAPHLILYPVFALFYLTAAVLIRLAYLRVGATGRGEVSIKFYRTYDQGTEPEHIRVVTRHFINLLEVPLLFYVIVILTYITQRVGYGMIGCAWAYVALRYVHSFVHLTGNDVRLRFQIYAASGLVLIIMWTMLLIELLRG